ncbi:unnamed protein product [Blepharisma stoltei]|uniref:MATE family efflux transporter n=1 Tax=Blepharisma stoltei TaxID=1481888 RepID=A0AAU9IIG1_9CILI|nr:unnamed protein product [Blepharisma stoltei]
MSTTIQSSQEPLLEENQFKFRDLFSEFSRNAIHVAVGLIIQVQIRSMNLIFLSDKDIKISAGVGLGNMWANMTANAFSLGLAGGLDTLCSKAYGKQKYLKVGNWLNRGIVVMMIFYLFGISTWFYVKHIMVLININEEVAEYCEDFLYGSAIGFFFSYLYEAYKRYFQAQGVFWPWMTIGCITGVVHSLWAYIFIVVFDFKAFGAGCATSITYCLNFLLLLLYNHIYKFDKKSKSPWTTRKFWKQEKMFLKIAFSSALLYFFVFFNYEIGHIEAGQLSVPIQTAHVCMVSLSSVIFMIPVASGQTVAVSVGKALGAGNRKKAHNYVNASFLFLLLTVFPLSALTVILRNIWPAYFSTDLEVQEIAANTCWMLGILLMATACETNLQGVLRGIGLQNKAAIVFLLIYYVVGMPSGVLFTFIFEWNLSGIWGGFIVAESLASIGMLALLKKVDWLSVKHK